MDLKGETVEIWYIAVEKQKRKSDLYLPKFTKLYGVFIRYI